MAEPRRTAGGLRQRLVGDDSLVPLALLTTLRFTDTFGTAAFLLLVPDIRDYYGVSLTRVEILVTIAALLPLLISVPIGYLSDRTRRSVLLGIGFVMSGLFALGSAFAPGLLVLGAMRLGAGLGLCFEGSAQSMVSDTYPLGRRSAVLTVLSMALPAGLCLGPLVA